MERAERWLVAMATVTLITLTAAMHYHLGVWYQQDALLAVSGFSIPGGLGPIFLSAHVIKVLLLPAAVRLWRRRQRAGAILAVALFGAIATISVGNTLGALSIQRDGRASAEKAASQRQADLRVELADLDHRLMTIGWRRAVAEIEADLSAERLSEWWQATTGCTSTATRLQRTSCARFARLKGDLAPAKEAEEARRRQREIRVELSEQASPSDARHPDVAFLARALGMSADDVAFGRTLLIALVLEALEAIPLWLLALLAVTVQQRSGPAAHRIGWLARTKAWYARLRPAPISMNSDKHSAAANPNNGEPPELRPRHANNRGRSNSSRPSRPAEEERISAIHDFVGQLILDPTGRETGSALFAAYGRRRLLSGWPLVPASTFGELLKPAIEAVGGQKRKSNQQHYVGVRLPPGW